MFLTEEEVFQASYLTMKGWRYNRWEKKWSKEGFLKDTWSLHNCGCCRKEGKTEFFHLADAYDAQEQKDYEDEENARRLDQGTQEGADVGKETDGVSPEADHGHRKV